MCGIIVDMTIINILIRECFQQLIPVLDNKNENYGDYVGNNFINVNLINLFTNDYINEKTSLLIWDLLFIDGNIILIKAFLAIYHYLQPFLLESSQTIENFQIIIKNHMKKLENDDKDLLFYLVIKEYNFNEEEIEQARFSLSINTANSINKEKIKSAVYDKKDKDDINCDKDWPVCLSEDCESQNRVIFCNVLQRKNKNYIDNYFNTKIKEKNRIKVIDDINEDIDCNNLLIQRKVHHCSDGKEDKNKKNKSENNENKIENNDDINKEINYNKIINKPEFIEASKEVLNNLKLKLKLNKDDKKEALKENK